MMGFTTPKIPSTTLPAVRFTPRTVPGAAGAWQATAMAGEDILRATIRRLAGVAAATDGPDDVIAGRALDVLAAAAPGSERDARLYGVLRVPLERRAGRRPAAATAEDALAERLEDRLATLVVAMEDARAAGDDSRADALHARYIELATTYVTRLVR